MTWRERPSARSRYGATSRATTSLSPPGANGTIRRTGRLGGVGEEARAAREEERERGEDGASGCGRGHAASFSISPMTASPICVVLTTSAPADLMSAVRRPLASAAAIA